MNWQLRAHADLPIKDALKGMKNVKIKGQIKLIKGLTENEQVENAEN